MAVAVMGAMEEERAAGRMVAVSEGAMVAGEAVVDLVEAWKGVVAAVEVVERVVVAQVVAAGSEGAGGRGAAEETAVGMAVGKVAGLVEKEVAAPAADLVEVTGAEAREDTAGKMAVMVEMAEGLTLQLSLDILKRMTSLLQGMAAYC